jgi:hypothetical protein
MTQCQANNHYCTFIPTDWAFMIFYFVFGTLLHISFKEKP